MLTKKAIRYRKLSSSEIQEILRFLEVLGDVILSKTDNYTTFYVMTKFDDKDLYLYLSPNITSVNKEFYINNKQFK